jgi:8-amino-7-oxononanoate synthase
MHRRVFAEVLEDLDRRHLRRVPDVVPEDGIVLGDGENGENGEQNGEHNREMHSSVLDFRTNDYLGLAGHPEVRRAVAHAALFYGTHRSSPVVGGYTVHHRLLEKELSDLKRTEECILFSSGFAANLGVMSVLASLGYQFLSDELNHASLIDGMRGAKVKPLIYRHNDLAHLEELLLTTTTTTTAEKKMIAVVTDHLFSMDGDLCDLDGLVRLQEAHGFLLVLDEAHSTLVVHMSSPERYTIDTIDTIDKHTTTENDISIVRIGTLSKAIGQTGGFVCCCRELRDVLFNRARPFVYSTALGVPTVVGARKAIQIARGPEGDRRRRTLRKAARRAGAQSPIIVVPCTDEATLQRGRDVLRKEGALVGAIRPPTVPTCRFRLSITADFSDEVVLRWVRRARQLSGYPEQQEEPMHPKL